MEVKTISMEIIKPASPTPPHLRLFNPCLLDQISSHVFTHLILYYTHHQIGEATVPGISSRLKSSLSQCLVQFYPLAGKYAAKENWIECNDQGVEFHETRVHYHLEELFKKPGQGLSELVPCHCTCIKYSGREDALLAVQANFFDCGGLALGVSLSHFVGDMASFVTFLNSWASAGDESVNHPKLNIFQYHHLFPQTPGTTRATFPFVTDSFMKRFVIDEHDVAALRRKSGGAPTRVQALTALVCRCLARATRKGDGQDERRFIVSQTVDLRRRMEPPLPDYAFGNFWAVAIALPEGSPADDQDGRLEAQIRDSIKYIDGAFVEELQGPHGYKKPMEAFEDAMRKYQGKEVEILLLTSWCKFRYYEVDFGWGKPQWVTPAMLPVKNGCLLLDQREGNGVELWVAMEARDLVKFENDQELLSYVSTPKNYV